ncbi:hypothetical protein [Streptosporangium sp. NPDC050280]|uniref:hypothetical protein n=1 Tax=unclassified Streptosporangium TaxID=2632669 RepID=UPI003435A44C
MLQDDQADVFRLIRAVLSGGKSVRIRAYRSRTSHGSSGVRTQRIETVYRKQIRPVLIQGAEAMDDIFGSQSLKPRPEDQERGVLAGGHYWVRTSDISLVRRSERGHDQGQ